MDLIGKRAGFEVDHFETSPAMVADAMPGVPTGGRGRRACSCAAGQLDYGWGTSGTQGYWRVLRMVPCLSQDALSGTIKINLCLIQEAVNHAISCLSCALGGVSVRRRSAAHGCADAHTDRRRSDPSSRCLLQVGYQDLWAITGVLKCHILSSLTAL